MDLKEYTLPKESIIGGWYISDKICDDLIQLFRSNKENQAPGIVGPSLKIELDQKASTEIAFHPDYDHPSFIEYKKSLEQIIHNYEDKYPEVKNFDKFGMIESPQIQHYKPGEGFKIWHCEREGKKENRCLVFMTFLNTVSKGGTHFKYQDLTVPAEKGLTLMWPTDFTHTHKGQVNKKFEKYILTGWLGYI